MKRLLFCAILLFIHLNCSNSDKIRPIERTSAKMSTFVKIVIYDNNIPETQVEKIIDEAFLAIDRVDSIANRWNDSSVVAKINKNAGKDFVLLDDDLIKILQESKHISEISDGVFDITIAPLLDAWNFHDFGSKVPTQEEISTALPFVNYKDLIIDGNQVKLSKKGMKIDLGGIAKGFAVDKALDVIRKNGVTDALINAGGDIKAICSPLTKGKRNIWIKHPRDREKLFAHFKADDCNIATSGDYEQFFIADSVRYHHIIDPKTGYPANKSVSATISARTAMLADALATAVLILGPEKGIALINNLEETEGIIIYEKDDKLFHVTSKGLEGKLMLVE